MESGWGCHGSRKRTTGDGNWEKTFYYLNDLKKSIPLSLAIVGASIFIINQESIGKKPSCFDLYRTK